MELLAVLIFSGIIVIYCKISRISKELADLRKLLLPTPDVEAEMEVRSEPEAVPEAECEPVPVTSVKVPREKSEFERRTVEILQKMWSWLIVGDEYRKPELSREYQVATTWLLRGAILLILFGLAYFIKYSHDRNLVPPELRGGTAVLFSLAMIVAGCRWTGGKYHLFGVTLAGGGFAGLYMSVFASVGIYHLLAPLAGLGLLAALTAGGCVLAVRLDQMLLAILAIIGGYAAPVLMSTGSRNLAGFFTYLAILTLGALGISRYRNWRILNILAFTGCWGLFFAADPFGGDQNSFCGIGFAALFFLLFSLMTVLYNVVNRVRITMIELLLQIINAVLFLGSVLPIVSRDFGNEWSGALALTAALWFAGQLAFLLKQGSMDKNLLLTDAVLGSSLLALAIPLMLTAEVVTAAWSVQAVAMLYLGVRSRSPFLVRLSYLVFLLAGGRLLFCNLETCYFIRYSVPDFAERLLNFGGFAAALGAAYRILKKCDCVESAPDSCRMKIMLWIIVGVLFAAGCGELALLDRFDVSGAVISGLQSVWGALFLVTAALLFRRYREQWIAWLGLLGLLVLTLQLLSSTGWRWGDCEWIIRLMRYIVTLALVCLAGNIYRRCGELLNRKIFLAAAGAVWFYYSSRELFCAIRHQIPEAAKIAVSLLWGVYAFALLAHGVLKKYRSCRIIGLVLFVVAMLKVFLYDLSHASAISRIAGCMLLGIGMMAGAWVYTRFKGRFENVP